MEPSVIKPGASTENIVESSKPIGNFISPTRIRMKYPLIATLYAHGSSTPDYENGATDEFPYPGFSAGSGTGYAYGDHLGDFEERQLLTEDYLSGYFTPKAMEALKVMVGNLGWCTTGNCFSNCWGRHYQSYFNWHVHLDVMGNAQLHTIPLPERYFENLSDYFSDEQVQEMKDIKLEDIAYDDRGNSIWSQNGIMMLTPVVGDPNRFIVNGSKEIIGGTGIFSGASGTYNFSGTYVTMLRRPPLTPRTPGQPNIISRITKIGLWGTIEYWIVGPDISEQYPKRPPIEANIATDSQLKA